MCNLSFDPIISKAVLIGVSSYNYLPDIEPAENNVIDIASFLSDSKYVGMPKENILTIVNKRNDDIFQEVVDFLQRDGNNRIDTLIFYYTGHGIRELNSGEFYLTAINTNRDFLRSSAINFNDLKDFLEVSLIKKRIIIIDACYSGMAAMGDTAGPYTNDEIDIKGSYTLTSSSGGEKSFFDPADRNTYFTATFLDYMQTGASKLKQPFIALDDIYLYLQKKHRLSTAHRKSNLNVTDFYFAINPFFDPLSEMEKKADELYDAFNFRRALEIYYEVHYSRPSEKTTSRIKKCMANLEFVEKTNKAAQAPEAEVFLPKVFMPIPHNDIDNTTTVDSDIADGARQPVILGLATDESLIVDAYRSDCDKDENNAHIGNSDQPEVSMSVTKKEASIFLTLLGWVSNLFCLAIIVYGVYYFNTHFDEFKNSKKNELFDKYKPVTVPVEMNANHYEKNIFTITNSITIGTQIWTTKNCNTTHYRNGDSILEAKTAKEWDDYGKQKIGCWCRPIPSKGSIYHQAPEDWGKLYNWYAVNDPRGFAPEGWHLPSCKEWETLFGFVAKTYNIQEDKKEQIPPKLMTNELEWGMPQYGSGKIPAKSKTDLRLPPSGTRYGGGLDSVGSSTFNLGEWWTSTEESSINYTICFILGIRHSISSKDKAGGAAVRFIQN